MGGADWEEMQIKTIRTSRKLVGLDAPVGVGGAGGDAAKVSCEEG